MARIALLIGVSEYQPGLNKLAGAVKDIEAMRRVLQHPEMGGFSESEIIIMPNPQRQDMENAIEKLFDNRKKDDLLLLYFSGHGITDDTGKLYLTNSQTRKYDNGNLVKTTATPASLIHEFMENSRSQRQVIILDACFSGAFAEGMKAKDDSSVDINQQLGGKGRAVLTSSSSSQYSFEQTGEELSVYTRYIVNGIETGAADTDNDGVISVDELHEFARKKVQEAAPAMSPKIYAVEEGFKIKVAKAPVGNPKLKYRKEVEKYLRDGKISTIGNRILKRYQNELGLSDDEVKQIQNEVLEPIRIYQANLKEYEEAIQEAVKYEENLSQVTLDELKHFQQILQLRDEDVEPIHDRLISFSSNLFGEEVKESENKSSQEKQTLIVENTIIPSSEDDLSSEKGIDYTKLRDLLKAGNWEEADHETYLVMLKAVGREEGGWIKDEELLNFPCTDLRTIDKLWVKYSNGHFGFTVQKEIYLSVGGIADGKYYEEAWIKFKEKVGWTVKGKWVDKVYTKESPSGHLPDFIKKVEKMIEIKKSEENIRGMGGMDRTFWEKYLESVRYILRISNTNLILSSLASRLVNCNI